MESIPSARELKAIAGAWDVFCVVDGGSEGWRRITPDMVYSPDDVSQIPGSRPDYIPALPGR